MDKFILQGSETFNLAPFKYRWAFTMAQKSLKNHWHPQEIPMGADKACYDLTLSEDERYMFRHVFATLTTADLAIATNLTERIYSLIKAAELKLYLARQIAEEALHSVSYQHVIEVLGLDQAETYGLYKQLPEIAQWFDWAQQQQESDDIVLPLIFQYAIWEGTFFPCAFASIYSLQRRRLMTGTGEQIQYIHRDETMHISFGIRLINEVMEELNRRPTQETVHSLFEQSMLRLDRWADRCIPAVVGYSAQLHKEHSRYLADRRLKQLGYAPLFMAQDVLPWLDEQASVRKEKNFFESRVLEYQTGGSLSFDESSAGIDSVANWRGV